MDTFRSLTRVFPLRGDEHELRDVGASYFKAFRRYPLKEIQAAADVWTASGRRFPKPAEWLESIPKRHVAAALDTLTEAEGHAFRRAEALGFEDAPCACAVCVTAGVTHRPLRFVPERTVDGHDRHVLDGERIVTAGHWAHGDELGRWYAAKEAFWMQMAEREGAASQRRLEPRFAQIGVEPHTPKKRSEFRQVTEGQ